VPSKETCDGIDNDCNNKIDDVSCDDGNACTADSCGGKKGCQNVAQNGAVCSDGNACTSGDACSGKTCKAGAKPTCDDGNPCTVDVCHAVKGCETGLVAGACGAEGLRPYRMIMQYSGKGCADSNNGQGEKAPCNGSANGTSPATISVKGKKGEALFSGSVKVGESFMFDASVTGDEKLPSLLLVEIRSASGALLESSSPHTSCSVPIKAGDVYGSLKLIGLWAKPPGNSAATNKPLEGKPCGVGNKCISTGKCKKGVCHGAKAAKCDDKKPCTKDSCDPTKGCTHTPDAGSVCADGSKCVAQSTCKAGVCVAGAAKDCDDKNPCTTDSCDKKGGKCKHSHAKKGTKCEDGKACTTGDKCDKGKCKAGNDKSCKSDKSDKDGESENDDDDDDDDKKGSKKDSKKDDDDKKDSKKDDEDDD
jgi:hypothetical protein